MKERSSVGCELGHDGKSRGGKKKCRDREGENWESLRVSRSGMTCVERDQFRSSCGKATSRPYKMRRVWSLTAHPDEGEFLPIGNLGWRFSAQEE